MTTLWLYSDDLRDAALRVRGLSPGGVALGVEKHRMLEAFHKEVGVLGDDLEMIQLLQRRVALALEGQDPDGAREGGRYRCFGEDHMNLHVGCILR